MSVAPKTLQGLVAALLLALSGCPGTPPTAPPETTRPQPTKVTLTVAMGGDPQLRDRINLLQGEWFESSGGQFKTVQVADWDPASIKQADLVLFPPRLLGQMCEAGQLRQVRESVLSSEQVAAKDYYPAVRDHVISYGGKVMALPIGCPLPLVALHTPAESPENALSWRELHVSREASAGLSLAERFMAQAAAYGVSPVSEALLFDPDSMQPKITGPPFVKAYTEMRAALTASAAMVLCPVRDSQQPQQATHVVELPAVREVFDPLSETWQRADGPGQQVTFIGWRGQLLGVTTETRNAAAAFRLLGWLASKANSRALATASPQVANVRQSLGRLPDDWPAAGDRGHARAVATALDAGWRNKTRFVIPRILQIDRYLAALNDRLAASLPGNQPAEACLDQVCQDWQALTEEVGRDNQRDAYLRHLGVVKYVPKKP